MLCSDLRNTMHTFCKEITFRKSEDISFHGLRSGRYLT